MTSAFGVRLGLGGHVRDGSPGDSQAHGDGKGQEAYGRGHRILGEHYKSDGAKPNERRHSYGAIHEHGNGSGNC
jgi:hypothetical protein